MTSSSYNWQRVSVYFWNFDKPLFVLGFVTAIRFLESTRIMVVSTDSVGGMILVRTT